MNKINEDAMQKLVKAFPYLEGYAKTLKACEAESARGYVLTTVAFVDELLSDLLLSFFADLDLSEKILSEKGSVIDTALKKAKLATVLGLITTDQLSLIKELLKARNKFAHIVNVSFDDEDVAEICYKIGKFWGLKAIHIEKRDLFSIGVCTIIMELSRRIHEGNHKCIPAVPLSYESLADFSNQ